MSRKLLKFIMPAMLVLCVGLSVVLFIETIKLKADNSTLMADIQKAEEKSKALSKKYSEEKAKNNVLQRGKMAADSQLRELSSKLETQGRQEQDACDEQEARAREMKKSAEACKSELSTLTNEIGKLKGRYGDLAAKIKENDDTLKKKDKELESRQGEIQSLKSQLKATGEKVDLAVNHNKQLSTLSKELLAEFDDQDVFQSLLKKEPFTQQKRVRLEKMIQEYLDRIDKDTLRKSETQ
jgi:chromosome segregation ATPase